MDDSLDKLKQGALKFRAGVYTKHAAAYQKAAAEPQRPHALIVTCADSRIDIEAITSSKPGDVFVSRNIGNMVPSYSRMPGGVSAVIEYAVTALKVQHIVVCGHTDCGAMKSLLDPDSTSAMPTVTSWLNNGISALRIAESIHAAEERDLLSVLIEQNVLMQMTHLRTHPSVAGATARKELTISGWIYDIAAGEMRIAESGSDTFVTLRDPAEKSPT